MLAKSPEPGQFSGVSVRGRYIQKAAQLKVSSSLPMIRKNKLLPIEVHKEIEASIVASSRFGKTNPNTSQSYPIHALGIRFQFYLITK